MGDSLLNRIENGPFDDRDTVFSYRWRFPFINGAVRT